MTEEIRKYFEAWVAWAQLNPWTVFQIAIATLVVLGAVILMWYESVRSRRRLRRRFHVVFKLAQQRHRNWKRGRLNMSKQKREAHLRQYLSDGITDVLEEGFLAGEVSREEVQFLYRRLANVLDLPDLLPRHVKTLKLRIKAETGKVPGPANPIPGPKPGEVIAVAITQTPARSAFAQRFLSKIA